MGGILQTAIRVAVVAVVILAIYLLLSSSLTGAAGNALLSSQDASAHGLAEIVPQGQGQGSDLQVHLDGLPASTDYQVTLDQDQCNGNVTSRVGHLTTGSDGSVVQTFPIDNLQGANQHPLWLDVRQPDGTSVACGQVQVNQDLLTRVSSSANNTTLADPQGLTTFPDTGVDPHSRPVEGYQPASHYR